MSSPVRQPPHIALAPGGAPDLGETTAKTTIRAWSSSSRLRRRGPFRASWVRNTTSRLPSATFATSRSEISGYRSRMGSSRSTSYQRRKPRPSKRFATPHRLRARSTSRQTLTARERRSPGTFSRRPTSTRIRSTASSSTRSRPRPSARRSTTRATST